MNRNLIKSKQIKSKNRFRSIPSLLTRWVTGALAMTFSASLLSFLFQQNYLDAEWRSLPISASGTQPLVCNRVHQGDRTLIIHSLHGKLGNTSRGGEPWESASQNLLQVISKLRTTDSHYHQAFLPSFLHFLFLICPKFYCCFMFSSVYFFYLLKILQWHGDIKYRDEYSMLKYNFTCVWLFWCCKRNIYIRLILEPKTMKIYEVTVFISAI